MKIGISSDGREMHYSAGILLEHNGKYLLMDRRYPPPGFAGPAGHIDDGEDAHTAALRELKEETGIELKELELLYEEEVPWNYCRSATVHRWYLYKASIDTPEFTIEEDEARSANWYSPAEIKELVLEEVWKYWFEKLEIV